MMYGSGDVKNPLPESLDLMEDMVVDFITQMVSVSALMNTVTNVIVSCRPAEPSASPDVATAFVRTTCCSPFRTSLACTHAPRSCCA